MKRFFIGLYNFFSVHKFFMYAILLMLVSFMGISLAKLNYKEDILSFLPDSSNNYSKLLKGVGLSDKMVIMFSLKDAKEADSESIMAFAEEFSLSLNKDILFKKNAKITSKIDSSLLKSLNNFAYDNLPLFLEDEDYASIEESMTADNLRQKMSENFDYLASPMGAFMGDGIFRDPLSMATPALRAFEGMSSAFEYSLVDSYIFSKDKSTLLAYVDMQESISQADKDYIVELVESEILAMEARHANAEVEYFGVPAVAMYNANLIKADSFIATSLAFLIILMLFYFVFRSVKALLLIFVPVIFSALLSLSVIYLIKGEISLIALGVSSVTLGIALSYSIHFVCSLYHSKSAEELIEELVMPLTIGSFTTICAFFALMFTSSSLLRDFGLFSALALCFTTLFILIFLPHFCSYDKADNISLKLKSLPKKFSVFVSISIILFAGIAIIFFNDIHFNSDMMKLSYMPPKLEKAENKLNEMMSLDSDSSNITFISNAENLDKAILNYKKLIAILDDFEQSQDVISYSAVDKFTQTSKAQDEKLRRWNDFWTDEKRTKLISSIEIESEKLGFEENAFEDFNALLTKTYSKVNYETLGEDIDFFSNWILLKDGDVSIIAQAKIKNESKDKIYNVIFEEDGLYAMDKSFLASQLVEDVYDDFNFILYFCAILVFLALLISYGRLELALLAFLPMFISWVLIIGIMDIFGLEFNIVTVLLSVFIFGVGDDFSIFVMDGLLNKYRKDSAVIKQHRLAILLSATTIIVGIGVLVFARHPCMYSLGIISLIGMSVVLFVSFTIQSFLFDIFIGNPKSKGGLPYTILSLISTIYSFFLFGFGLFLSYILAVILDILPFNKEKKQAFLCGFLTLFARTFFSLLPFVRRICINEQGEDFSKPSIIIANHQSLVDIMILLSLNKKSVILVKPWVFNSIFLGRVVKYMGCCNVDEGYEQILEKLRAKIALGYSIVVFPEGTRSSDLRVKRFHKGAFYLANALKLDILPILIYGTGLVCSRNQSFYIKRGSMLVKLLPRIKYDTSNEDYSKKTKEVSRYFKAEYHKLYEEYNRTKNPYIRYALIKNYSYKGVVLENYYRIKLAMDSCYEIYDNIVPRSGTIVDLGCGYGGLSYALSLLSYDRKLIAVDYDEDKLSLATNCPLKNDNISFVCGDLNTFDVPKADAYIINDVLHYLEPSVQRDILKKCALNMNENAVILIRESDSSLLKKHFYSNLIEFFSIKVLCFNKSKQRLYFLSKDKLLLIVEDLGLTLSVVKQQENTSNTLFLLKKRKLDNE